MLKCGYPGCLNPWKNESEFSLQSGRPRGRQGRCKDCCKQFVKDNKFYWKNYLYENWPKTLVAQAARTSNVRGHPPPTITGEWVQETYSKVEGRCYWSQVKMIPSIENHNLFKPSLDRLDTTRGYDADNVVLVCFGINMARGVASVEHFTEFLRSVKCT